MQITLKQCFFILAVLVPIIYWMWQYYYKLAKKEVIRWAKDNRFELISIKRSQWDLGPFQWKAVRGQEVFQFTIKDQNNNTRSGWLRVNVPFLFGAKLFKSLGSAQHAVIWNNEK